MYYFTVALVIIIIIIIRTIIKNNIIIIIRTFLEFFSPEKFSWPNNFINIKRSKMLRHVDVDTNHEISLMSDLVW